MQPPKRRAIIAVVLVASLAAPVFAHASGTITQLGCGAAGHTLAQFDAKPTYCDLNWHLSGAWPIQLQRISWRSWGGTEAGGRAVFHVKIYEPWTRVRVLAFRRRDCGPVGVIANLRLYTRVRITFPRTWLPSSSPIRQTWRTPPCSALRAVVLRDRYLRPPPPRPHRRPHLRCARRARAAVAARRRLRRPHVVIGPTRA